MDMKQASYLTSGVANWQQGVGMLVENKQGRFVPYTVPIINGEIQLP